MTRRNKMSLDSERSFEELFGRVRKRPAPSPSEFDAARAAIKAEWRSVAARQRRRRWTAYAAAASVVLALAIVASVINPTAPRPISIASIDRSRGAIYLLGEQSELNRLGDLDTLYSAQTIETGPDASLGILWGEGGSLRVDERTRLVLADKQVVELVRGRIYYDSLGAEGEPLIIRTSNGDVSHAGTQYMVDTRGTELSVSVREGRVAVDGRFYDATADAGERVVLRDSTPPQLDAIKASGDDWYWVEAMAPNVDFNGRGVLDLVNWAAHETGLVVDYSNAAVRQIVADNEPLNGRFDAPPRVALRQALLANGLDYRISGSVLTIFDVETGND